MQEFDDFTTPAGIHYIADSLSDDDMDDFAPELAHNISHTRTSLSTFDTTSVESSIRDILIDFSGIKARAYSKECLLSTDLGLDSLDRVELVMMCEANFGISMPDHEWTGVQTAGDLVELIQGKLCRV